MNSLETLAAELAPLLAQQKARQFGVGYETTYGTKHDATGTPISFGYSHGPGGLLTFPGVDPTVFHTILGPRSILGQLPTRGSTNTNPTFLTLTGVQDIAGSEPDAVCSNAPTAGLLKGCLTHAVFGRYSRQTGELDLSRLGKTVDRADPMDLQLVGSPIDSAGIFSAGARSPATPADVLTNEVSRKFWEMNVAFHRLLARQLWIGNPANNTGAGGYKEVTGLDLLINTGYEDAETGVVCPANDSYVRSFSNQRIDIVGSNLVSELTNMYWQMKDRAERLSLMPVRWVFAMRPQMFYELTAAWPCVYMSYRCTPITGSTNFIDAGDQVRMRDEMRAGRYLLIDGERVEVVLDDGIAEDNGNESGSFPRGCFRSSIYLIPMSVIGGRSVTYLEYFEYDNPSIRDAIGNMALARVEGPFLVWPRQTNNCIVWQALVEPRVVLRTPFLAAKLTNVVYCPIDHERDAFPNEPYFVNGGRTNRVAQGPSYHSHWQS